MEDTVWVVFNAAGMAISFYVVRLFNVIYLSYALLIVSTEDASDLGFLRQAKAH